MNIIWRRQRKGASKNVVKRSGRRKIMEEKYLDKKVIIRGDRSGVFFGTLVRREGREVELKDCRRL